MSDIVSHPYKETGKIIVLYMLKVKVKGKGKCKGKGHPRTDREGPEVEFRYSSTLSLTSALDGVVVNATPRPLCPREGPGTHCIVGLVGPRAGLDGCGKSRQHRDSIP
jgi:hypothetical protein